MGTRQQPFRTLMGRFATGVTVVAARQGDGIGAMTASAVTAVSLDPPMLLACFRSVSRLLPSLLQVRSYSVNVLSAAQAGASRYCAGQSGDAYPARWSLELAEAPVPDGAIATFACRVAFDRRPRGHALHRWHGESRNENARVHHSGVVAGKPGCGGRI